MSRLMLEFYGVKVSIVGEDETILDRLGSRFKFFCSDAVSSDVEIMFSKESKDLTQYPSLKSIGLTPRNFYFREEERLFADYFGKAFTIYDLKQMKLEIFCEDDDLIYEIVYLFILSQTGTLLEEKGIYRTHGVAFENCGKGYLILLPSGGGKSSLAMRLINQAEVHLISEDCPLVGPGNQLYSFPLGIGVNPELLGINVSDRDIFSYNRMEFSRKSVVLPQYYLNRISRKKITLRFILIGKRSLGKEARIVKCSSFTVLMGLIKKMVIGLGLFQGIEYLLHRHRLLKPWMIWLLVRRFLKAVRMMMRTNKYVFHMSYDYDHNYKVLTDFLKRNC